MFLSTSTRITFLSGIQCIADICEYSWDTLRNKAANESILKNKNRKEDDDGVESEEFYRDRNEALTCWFLNQLTLFLFPSPWES